MEGNRVIGNAYKVCPGCASRSPGDTRYCASCGQDLAKVASVEGDPYLGLVLAGKYVIEELIGEGAMGRVYKAKQTTLGKPFAAKILAPHLLHDEQSHARFAAEAHNAASLNHPNCVSVVDYGETAEGIAFIVMEYIKGITLERIIAEQFPLPQARIVDLSVQILAALTEAHGLGILHRDLKPENILVQQLRTHGELAMVLDFGIAKLMEEQSAAGTGLTSQGMVCGTPEYMSPEQARGHKLDQRSDLYAVGVILYQMLAGRPPFESSSAVEVLHKHLSEEPVPPSRLLGTPPSPLEAVCLRAMAKDPAQRYGSAAEFRDEIIGANSSVVPGTHVCGACGADMRSEHRFCPICGAPSGHRTPRPVRRHPTRGSGMTPRLNEATAEVVVRNFPLPLVGRDLVLQRVRGLLVRPQPGVRVRVLAGPRGVGKTRLGDEIASMAESLGWRAYYIGGDPSGARTPLWPIQSMVAQLLELDPNTVTTQDLGRVANTRGLSFEELPGLAELFSLQGPALPLELGVRRRECFASAVQALLAGGHGQPLLLFFDDIDGYDSPSREILRRLSTAFAATPVFALCTSAEPDLQWLHGSIEKLDLLGPEAVERIGRQITMELNPKSKLPEALARVAPLSPLRLENHLRLLASGVQASGTASVEELLKARFDDLDEVAKRLLECASVLGERFFELDLMDLIAGDGANPGEARIDAALRHLHVAGLLVIIGDGERAFSHGVFHEVVYRALPEERRAALHARAASVSRMARSSVTVHAMHLVRARAEELVDPLYEAAVNAERCFDDPLAAEFVHVVLLHLGSLPDPTPFEALDIVLALMAARVMRTPQTHPIAIELLEQRATRATSPDHEARLLTASGHVKARAGLHAEAVATLKRAMGPAIAAGDRPTMVEIYFEIARVYANQNDFKRAVSELSEGLDFFTLGEGPRAPVDFTLWRYLLRICEYSRSAGETRKAREWCEHALWQAERVADRLGLLRCHAQMAWILRDLNQLALAERHMARALDEARHFGDRLTTAELLIERARARAARGRLADAKRCCEEALRLARSIQWASGIEHAERAIGMLNRQEEGGSGPSESSTRLSMRRGQGGS